MPMRFDIVTIFPEFFNGPLDYGIVRRARESGLIDVHTHDLREFTHDRHRTVDERPFGGGEGMILKPEPLFEAVEALGITVSSAAATPPAYAVSAGSTSADRTTSDAMPALPAAIPVGAVSLTSGSSEALRNATAVVLLSASGKLFRQRTAQRLAGFARVVLLCGRYEGVDERVAEHLATEELSIGDFVLSGGELAAALVIDAVTRLLPGALGNEASSVHESFSDAISLPASADAEGRRQTASDRAASNVAEDSADDNLIKGAADLLANGAAPAACLLARPSVLLDWPHYTRPAEYRSWAVPEVLLSGNHREIARWRLGAALQKTRRNRPDLLSGASF